MKTENLVGLSFGRLMVVGEDWSLDRKGWLCRCECGVEKAVRTSHLKSGVIKSCGRCAALGNQNAVVHGHTRRRQLSPEWVSWSCMLSRCKSDEGGKREVYKDRGISVCERWEHFEAFLADMGEKPTARHTIDRIDNERGYEPGNCRWATAKEQAANRRRRASAVGSSGR